MSSREEELQRVVRFEWMQVQQRGFKTRNLILPCEQDYVGHR
jgi:hypothetical protein